jgi:hypothetical protein
MAKQVEKQAKKRKAAPKGRKKLTVMDLIVTLENIENWVGAVRQALETLPPTMALPPGTKGPVPPPLARYECRTERARPDSSWPRPAWLCRQSDEALNSDVGPGVTESVAKQAPGKRSKLPKR